MPLGLGPLTRLMPKLLQSQGGKKLPFLGSAPVCRQSSMPCETENELPVNAKTVRARPVEEIYQKKTQLEHILLRPDTYIGSVERNEQPMWVFDRTAGRMVQRNVSFVPGLFKIFDEILVNASDNKIRDPSMDTLKVNIDREAGSISIYNNGHGIPIEMHSKEKVYVPELIFGQLLTSSNYDDAEKKVTGGRNGYGAKLCNIFSKEFIVETADSSKKQTYRQVFSDNMSKRGAPELKKGGKEDFTQITFRPDLSKFGMTNLDDDIVALLERRVYDIAGCVRDVKVYLNGERLPVKSFKEYVQLFTPKPELGALPTAPVVHEKVNDRWEVCVTVSEGSFQHMSFVNSICTYKGGAHVSYITDQLTSSLQDIIKKKNKDLSTLKPQQIKNHLSVFVNCLIENPSFDSQTKEFMTLRASAFGSKCVLGDGFMKKVAACGVVENVLQFAKFKQTQQLKKTDGAKRNRLSGIAKLDDANNAGTKNASKCTLIITEGDSAKALAVSGLGVVGRDNYGVFPLRGKLLNVREATHKQILENQEINYLKQILGLQHGQVYTSVSTLRYGSLMIMTDQDHDGSHIKGLVINFLEHFFPSLLKIPGFLVEFITPIVKASKGREEIVFYTIPEYETWKEAHNNGRGWTVKYYKGLGTSTAADARKYFAAMDRHRKVFAPIKDEERQLVDMAFNKKRTDDRKEWLKTCTPGTFMDTSVEVISIGDFINKELILFSMADNARSIPCIVDGLKPGHRKILFSCFKRKLKNEIKVAQLAGYVAEHSAYHHGEQSLCGTIIGMAQTFVGSNNVNLLEPNGQFGTRLQGGKDAASPRYVFTSLSPFARLLYRPEDDALLKYLNDDGQSIEPEWYIPILPLLLVNGCDGIGTGWSTTIPSFNPRDVADNLLKMMDGESANAIHPWYHGFTGPIEPVGADRYSIHGVWRRTDETTVEITELPVGSWTQNYKEMLEAMLAGADKGEPLIKDYKEYHTDTTVHFVLSLSEAGVKCYTDNDFERRFKISSYTNINNIVCFDKEGLLRKYASPLAVLEDFYHLRLEYYVKRKEWMADQLTKEWTRLDNRVRFVQEIIDGKLVVQNRKKRDIITDLAARGYAKDNAVPESETSDTEDSVASNRDYDYLLTMPIYSLTREKVEKLMAERDEKETELNKLLAKTPKTLWKSDLAEFLAAWDAHETSSKHITEVERAKALGKPVPVRKSVKKSVNRKAAYSDIETSFDEESAEEAEYIPAKKTIVPPTKKRTYNRKTESEPVKKNKKSTQSEKLGQPGQMIQPGQMSQPGQLSRSTSNSDIEVATANAPKTLDAETINNMPLAERINYMLQQRTKQSTLDFKPTKPRIILSDDE